MEKNTPEYKVPPHFSNGRNNENEPKIFWNGLFQARIDPKMSPRRSRCL